MFSNFRALELSPRATQCLSRTKCVWRYLICFRIIVFFLLVCWFNSSSLRRVWIYICVWKVFDAYREKLYTFVFEHTTTHIEIVIKRTHRIMLSFFVVVKYIILQCQARRGQCDVGRARARCRHANARGMIMRHSGNCVNCRIDELMNVAR